MGIRIMKNAKGQSVLCAPGLINNIGYADVENNYAGAVLVNQLDTQAYATDMLLNEIAASMNTINVEKDGEGNGKKKTKEVPALVWKRMYGAANGGATTTNN